MRPRISVQWAASIASVFWGVWWASFVQDIAGSSVASIQIMGQAVSRNWVLVALVLWGVIYAIVFVRWLARVQYWGWHTGIGHWLHSSRSLLLVIAVLILALKALPSQFHVTNELIAYGVAIAVFWPVAPFIVAIWPEERE